MRWGIPTTNRGIEIRRSLIVPNGAAPLAQNCIHIILVRRAGLLASTPARGGVCKRRGSGVWVVPPADRRSVCCARRTGSGVSHRLLPSLVLSTATGLLEVAAPARTRRSDGHGHGTEREDPHRATAAHDYIGVAQPSQSRAPRARKRRADTHPRWLCVDRASRSAPERQGQPLRKKDTEWKCEKMHSHARSNANSKKTALKSTCYEPVTAIEGAGTMLY